MRWTRLLALIFILVALILSIVFYPQLPDEVPSHWNAKGEVDNYMSKFWGISLMPIVAIIIFLLMVFLPKLDPLKKNYKDFRTEFETLILILILFFLYIHVLTIIWSLGTTFNMTFMMVPAFAGMFFYIGHLLEKSKRNWFVGIRTPWTLSDDRVWVKTHLLGGKLFKLAAAIALIGLFFDEHAILFTIIPIIIFVVFIALYSYLEYKKLHKKP